MMMSIGRIRAGQVRLRRHFVAPLPARSALEMLRIGAGLALPDDLLGGHGSPRRDRDRPGIVGCVRGGSQHPPAAFDLQR